MQYLILSTFPCRDSGCNSQKSYNNKEAGYAIKLYYFQVYLMINLQAGDRGWKSFNSGPSKSSKNSCQGDNYHKCRSNLKINFANPNLTKLKVPS